MNVGHRITSADFKTLRPTKRIQGAVFSLSIASRQQGPAWAVVVSKKISKKAVARNLVKRRCRSVLTYELKKFREPRALVFTAKRGAAEATFLDTKKDIETLLERAGLRGTMLGT
jgi:ribonuclease P protein component